MPLPFFFGVGIAVGTGTVISSAGLEDGFQDANWTDVLAGDGSPQQHTGSSNGGAESDHLGRVMEQINGQQEADPSENQSSEQNSTMEAAVNGSTNQSRDTKDELAAAKERAREAEFKLKKTDKELSKALQRAEHAEVKVHELEIAIQNWATWAKQQEQARQFSKNGRNAAATVANLKKKLQDTKQKLDTSKERDGVVESKLRKTEEDLSKALQKAERAEAKVLELKQANQEWAAWAKQQEHAQQSLKNSQNAAATVADLKKQLQETQEKLDAAKERASVVESRLGKTEKELITETVRANRAEAKVLDLSKAN